MGEVDEAEAALAQDPLDPVAPDALRSLGGNLVHGCRWIRAGAVGVVHGQCPRSRCFFVRADYTRGRAGSLPAGPTPYKARGRSSSSFGLRTLLLRPPTTAPASTARRPPAPPPLPWPARPAGAGPRTPGVLDERIRRQFD